MKEDANSASVEELYIREKKKSQILMFTTILLAALLVGSVMYFQMDNTNSNQLATVGSNVTKDGVSVGPGGGMGGGRIDTYFDEYGNFDKSALDDRIASMPEGFRPQFLSRLSAMVPAAVDNGTITQSQANELLLYLDTLSSESSSI